MPVDQMEIGPFLESLGYRHVSGYGPTAVWEVPGTGDPDDDDYEPPFRASEASLANSALGAQSPYQQARTQTGNDPSSAPAIRYDAEGRAFEWNENLDTWVVAEKFNDPTKAAGYEKPRSAASTAITPYQSAQLGTEYQRIQIERERLAQQIADADRQNAIDQEKLTLQRDVNRVNEEQGNKRLALDGQQIAESIAARIERTGLERQRLQQDLILTDRQIESTRQRQAEQQAFQAGESALGREFQAGESAIGREFAAGESALGRGFESQQGVNAFNMQGYGIQSQNQNAARTDATRRSEAAAEFAARGATDFGKLSSFLANGGLSPISTALGQGQSAITDESLIPLAALLAPPVQPGPLPQYERWVEPQRQPLTINSAIGKVNPAVTQPQQATLAPPVVTAQPAPVQDTTPGFTLGPNGQGVNLNAQEIMAGAVWQPTPTNPDGTFKFEHGGANVSLNTLMQLVQMLGMQPKAVAGEKGKAHGESIFSNGDVVVIPDKGAAVSGEPKMEFGGGVINDLLNRAKLYMSNAQQNTLRRGGLQDTPAPVVFSDPGTDSELQRFGASVAATTRGIPQQTYLNELMKLTPRSMQLGLNRRTY